MEIVLKPGDELIVKIQRSGKPADAEFKISHYQHADGVGAYVYAYTPDDKDRDGTIWDHEQI